MALTKKAFGFLSMAIFVSPNYTPVAIYLSSVGAQDFAQMNCGSIEVGADHIDGRSLVEISAQVRPDRAPALCIWETKPCGAIDGQSN